MAKTIDDMDDDEIYEGMDDEVSDDMEEIETKAEKQLNTRRRLEELREEKELRYQIMDDLESD